MKHNFRTPMFYLLVVIMLVSMTTCGYCQTTKENFKPVNWRMSNQHPDGNIADTADREMIEEIRKATEGRVNITLYNNNQLGDYLSVFEEVMIGSIEIHHGSTNEGYDSRVLGPFLPYLATGYEQLAKVYSPDSYLFKTLHDDVYAKLGMELMGFFCEGFDGVGSKTELKDPSVIGADKGILLRVPAMETFNQCNIMLGFRTSSIPFADTYTSIQTGLVDGASGVPANLFY
ncbi:TRAP transporter substrate-binding protein DctP, partial [uncultured Cloacibacillus sp.]|uniref:TRAP transporter substrate-binding protein DctP n=1 Tax=uncultured Cloacibacillus sp. TaxID=889794 RepID=UPI0026DAD2DE